MASEHEHIIRRLDGETEYIDVEAKNCLTMQTMNRHFYMDMLFDKHFHVLVGLAYGSFDILKDVELCPKKLGLPEFDIKDHNGLENYFKKHKRKFETIAYDKIEYCQHFT